MKNPDFVEGGGGYVIVTAAKDEESYIEPLLRSVITQTVLPRRWVVVSDGSTDSTAAIVKRYQQRHGFIDLLEIPPGDARHFGSKARAISAGYARIEDAHDYVAIQDADVSFEPTYYETIIARFRENPRLGIAGGMLFDKCEGGFVHQSISMEWSVCGAIQMFRRECWEGIGGYLPLKSGLDAAAEVMVRMRGWKVRTFPDARALHYRPVGTATKGFYRVQFDQGVADRQLGYHPLFFLARSVGRFGTKPYVSGGLAMLAGFAWASIRRAERPVPDDFVRFLRHEQLARLSHIFPPLRRRAT